MSNRFLGVALKPVGSKVRKPGFSRSNSEPFCLTKDEIDDDDAAEELANIRASLKKVASKRGLVIPVKFDHSKGRTPLARTTSPKPTFHVVLKPTTADSGDEEETEQYYFDLDYQFPPTPATSFNSKDAKPEEGGESGLFGTRLKPPAIPGVQGLTKTYQIDLNQCASDAKTGPTSNADSDSMWIPSGLIQKGPRSFMELKLKPDKFKPSTTSAVSSDSNHDYDCPSEIEMQMRHIALIPNQDGGPMRRKITSQTFVSIPLPLQPSIPPSASDLATPLTTTPTPTPVLLQIQLGELHQVDVDHSTFRVQMTYVDPETQEPLMDVVQEDLVVEWRHFMPVLPAIPDKDEKDTQQVSTAAISMAEKDSAPRMPARTRRLEDDVGLDKPDAHSMMKVDKAPSRPRRRGSGDASDASAAPAPAPPPTHLPRSGSCPSIITGRTNSNSSRTSKSKRGALGKRLPKKFRPKKLKLRHLPTLIEEEHDDEGEEENERAASPVQQTQREASCKEEVVKEKEANRPSTTRSVSFREMVELVDQDNDVSFSSLAPEQQVEEPVCHKETAQPLPASDTESVSDSDDDSDADDDDDSDSSDDDSESSDDDSDLEGDDEEPKPSNPKIKTSEAPREKVQPKEQKPKEPAPEPKELSPEKLATEKGRAILLWYVRMGNPSKDAMKRRVTNGSADSLDITVEDVEGLPWICGGIMLNVRVMNERFMLGQ